MPTSRACGCCAGRRTRAQHRPHRGTGRRSNCAASPRPAGATAAPAGRRRATDGADTAALERRAARVRRGGVDQEIARLASVLRPLDLLRNVLMPVLVQVGDDWHRGRAGIAHEHLMSSPFGTCSVRSSGCTRARTCRPACSSPPRLRRPPRDRHAGRGDARRQQRPGRGLSRARPSRTRHRREREARGRSGAGAGPDDDIGTRKTIEGQLRAIVRDLPKDVELWTGGRGAERHASIISPRGLLFGDYTAYQQELVRIGGRAA